MTLSLHQIITVETTPFPVMRAAVYLIHIAVMVLMTASTRQMKPIAQIQVCIVCTGFSRLDHFEVGGCIKTVTQTVQI